MYNDDISIVLAVYNGEKYLKRQIDSILGQVNTNIKEFIVVDDCSIDNSYNIIKNYIADFSNFILIKNEFNIGPIGSFIKGAKAATANYIAFADQDDIWLNNKLSLSLSLIKKIEITGKPSVVFTDLKMIDEEDKALHDSFWKLHNIRPGNNDFFTILFGNIITGCTMLINVKMLEELVTMPLEAEMHDHWVALVATSLGTWAFSEEKTVLYRVHNKSVTNKNKRTIKNSVSDLLKVIFKKSDYLDNYINQASLFKLKYSDKLDVNANTKLDHFINLQNSSGVVRKIKSKFRFTFSKR